MMLVLIMHAHAKIFSVSLMRNSSLVAKLLQLKNSGSSPDVKHLSSYKYGAASMYVYMYGMYVHPLVSR